MATKQMLREYNLFEHLSDTDLASITNITQPRQYEAGAIIFNEKSSAEELYILEKGKVALQMQLPASQPQVSKNVTVDMVTPKEVFGWSVLVEPYRYTLTAVCLEPTRILAIDGVKLRALIENDNRIGHKILSQIIKVVASRLDEARHVLISERLLSIQDQTL